MVTTPVALLALSALLELFVYTMTIIMTIRANNVDSANNASKQ